MQTLLTSSNALTKKPKKTTPKSSAEHTPSEPSGSAKQKASAYLVGAVQQGEDISLFHSHLPRTLLLVIIERQNKLFSSFIICGSNLLLTKKERKKN